MSPRPILHDSQGSQAPRPSIHQANSYVPPPCHPPVTGRPAATTPGPQTRRAVHCSLAAPPCNPGAARTGSPERCGAGVEVAIGSHRFRCLKVLGRGSFSEVWCAEALGRQDRVALKDVTCRSQGDLQQALLEVSLLERFQGPATVLPGQEAPLMRIPRYLAHSVDPSRGSWRVRVAMIRVPGEPLDAFLQRPQQPSQDGPALIRRGCAMAVQVLRQLGPTIDMLSQHAWHRDVNSRNVLIGDALDGGELQVRQDPEETASRASFWLIDFGLAVDATTWPSAWASADVAGDCRYWPPSSFVMSFYGADHMAQHPELCNQYKSRLDIVGLGITALEVLCTPAQSASGAWGETPVPNCWRRLLLDWEKYREDVTRWHLQIFQVFSSGGDIGPLYQQLAQEHVVDKVSAHFVKIRSQLRACASRIEEPRTKNLLGMLAEMIDERSNVSMQEVLNSLNPRSWEPPRQVASYTPPPVATVPSYTPPPVATVPGWSGASTVAPAAWSCPRSASPMPHARPQEPPGAKLQWCAPAIGTMSYQPPLKQRPQQVPAARETCRPAWAANVPLSARPHIAGA